MSNVKRTNPFRSPNHTNFPPIDEFFDQMESGENSPNTNDAGNTSAISLNTSIQSRAFNDLNFSVDMSIGGKAEMTQHRYHVQKYGIDGIHHDQQQQQQQGDGSPDNRTKRFRLSGGDDWDRLMDDNCSNISFSSTAIDAIKPNKKLVGYHSPSPDHSSDDDSGHSSFFEKSIVQSLMTPEKIRFKLGDEKGKSSGVTLSRGQVNDDSSASDDDDSPGRLTNVSSTGSGFEQMFHAALRFNEDFDEQSSFGKEEESLSADRSSGKDVSKDKSSSVSFAANTSFCTSDSRYRKSPNGLKGIDSLSASPIDNQNNDESFGTNSMKGFDFLSASPIHHPNKYTGFDASLSFPRDQSSPSPFTHEADKSEVSSIASSAYPTPRASPSPNGSGETASLSRGICPGVKTEQPSTDNLLLLGLSPIDSHAAKRNLKTPSMPFDESFSRVKNGDGLPSVQRHLFRNEYSNSSPMGQKNPTDQCCTHTTMKSEESFFQDTRTTSLLDEDSAYSYSRTFGSNAAFRINSNVSSVGRSVCNADNDCASSDNNNNSAVYSGNRRGVRLSRLSKLKELGLEHALSLSPNSSPKQYGDSSF